MVKLRIPLQSRRIISTGGSFLTSKKAEIRLLPVEVYLSNPLFTELVPADSPKTGGCAGGLFTICPAILAVCARTKIVSLIVEGIPVFVVHPFMRREQKLMEHLSFPRPVLKVEIPHRANSPALTVRAPTVLRNLRVIGVVHQRDLALS